MLKDQINQFFQVQYNAIALTEAQNREFLNDDCSPITGLAFVDPYENYTFLSESDMLAFPPDMANNIRKQQHSPFDRLLLIFYERDNTVSCKLVNGMGSDLLLLAQRFCTNE